MFIIYPLPWQAAGQGVLGKSQLGVLKVGVKVVVFISGCFLSILYSMYEVTACGVTFSVGASRLGIFIPPRAKAYYPCSTINGVKNRLSESSSVFPFCTYKYLLPTSENFSLSIKASIDEK
jgi:hypothetical protein